MPTQIIKYTVLPNGVAHRPRGRPRLRLSVYITPKLRPLVEPFTLEQFPDFQDWPQQIRQMTWRIQFGNNDPVPARRVSDDPDSELWQALFPESTPVNPHEYDDFSDHAIRSFPVKTVHDFIKTQYQNLAESSATELPAIEDLKQDDAFGVIHFDEATERELRKCIEVQLRQSKVVPSIFSCQVDGKTLGAEALAFFQAKVFHQAHVPLQDPDDENSEPAALAPPELDFHHKVSLLGEYPSLLRRLGLVVDLEVNLRPNIPNSATVQVAADTVGQDDERPRTQYLLAPQQFIAAPGVDGDELSLGFLNLSDERLFELIQLDVDGAALKLINFMKNMFLSTGPRKSFDTPTNAGVPILRSSGLAVIRNLRALRSVNAFSRIQGNVTALANGTDPVLFAEDLIRGYRVDVWDDQVDRWHSLCRRRAHYHFLEIDRDVEVEEEGIVSMGLTKAADGSDPDKLYLHENMLEWFGWSLCAPKPGLTLTHVPGEGEQIEDVDGNEGAEDLGLEKTFTVAAGSLPHLRYGHRYRVRARLTDIAGNSLPFDTPDDHAATDPRAYHRFEPLEPPALIPRNSFEDSPGESVAHLVIRSNFDEDATEDSQRHVVPPRGAQLLAEMYGRFDNGGVVDRNAYDLIISREGAFNPIEPGESLALPFLPDPAARGASFYNLPGMAGQVMQVAFEEGEGWYDLQPFRIRLIEGLEAPSFADGVLTVPLAKAEVVNVRMSCYLIEEHLEQMGIWNWLREKLEQDGSLAAEVKLWLLSQTALSGRHWMITPFANVTLVHAVRQPLQAPQLANLGTAKKLGATHATLAGNLIVHSKSTSKADINARWMEWVDNPNDSENPDPHQVERRQHVGEITVETGDDVIDLSKAIKQVKPDKIEEKSVRHNFGDTKFRAVDYSAVATTRFREYFNPPPSEEEPDPEGMFTRETEAPVRADVLNSARPAAPKVLYAVPVFGWEDQGTSAEERFGRARHGGGLRIYLNRPWYSSGDGELLAAILNVSVENGVPVKSFVPNNLKPFVSMWGVDPIWQSGFTRFDSPLPEHFTNAVATKFNLSLDELSQKETDNGSGSKIKREPVYNITAVGHEVHFDTERRLWFCDMFIDSLGSYYPFVRLALARFQPNSVKNAHLSRIALLDFAQLAPDRSFTITREAENLRLLRVSFFGQGYTATKLGAMTSEVEVFLECRLPNIADEDLGWEAVAGTLVKLMPVFPGISGARMAVTWLGEVNVPQLENSPRLRLAIREYERFRVDGETFGPVFPTGDQPIAVNVPTNRRLVYADAVELASFEQNANTNG